MNKQKFKSKVIFKKSKAIMLLNVKIIMIWDFMPCGLEKLNFSRNCSSNIRAGNDISQTTSSGAVFRVEALLLRWQRVNPICKTFFFTSFSHTAISVCIAVNLCRAFICFPT